MNVRILVNQIENVWITANVEISGDESAVMELLELIKTKYRIRD